MSGTSLSARDIRGLLQRRITDLLRKLFPNTDITTPIMTPLNPTRHDETPGSFVVWTSGAALGGFREFSSKRGPEASGDVIDLIAYAHNRAGDRGFALKWARDFLGLKAMSDQERRNARREGREAAHAITAATSEALARRRKKALTIWNRTQPILGTLAETYLASRRIPLRLIANREDDLRFLPRLEHWKSVRWDKTTEPWTRLSSQSFPAMVAAMRNLAGDVTAVHCTFLRADGAGKADLAEAKLMRGDARGSAIRLTRGDGDLSLDEARASGHLHTLMPFEGIETGLSYAIEVSEPRIWAAGSFDLMMALAVEREPLFDAVLYGRDNDNNAKADEAVTDRIAAIRAAGREAGQVRPPAGFKDFNDLIREDA